MHSQLQPFHEPLYDCNELPRQSVHWRFFHPGFSADACFRKKWSSVRLVHTHCHQKKFVFREEAFSHRAKLEFLVSRRIVHRSRKTGWRNRWAVLAYLLPPVHWCNIGIYNWRRPLDCLQVWRLEGFWYISNAARNRVIDVLSQFMSVVRIRPPRILWLQAEDSLNDSLHHLKSRSVRHAQVGCNFFMRTGVDKAFQCGN